MARIVGGLRTTNQARDVVVELIVQITSDDVTRGELLEGDFKKMLARVLDDLKQKLVEEMLPVARQAYLESVVTPELINESVRKAIVDRLADLLLPAAPRG